MKKRFLALLMSLIMMLSFSLTAYADEHATYVKRGELVERLLLAADDYHPGIIKEAIIKGDQTGNLRENEPVKRVEALVMLSRAFGELPTPVGQDLRTGIFNIAFNDVPSWAEEDINKLTKAGILIGKGNGKLGANDHITFKELQILLSRLFSLEGSNLKDDFYGTINKEVLDNYPLSDRDTYFSGFHALAQLNNARLLYIIDEYAGKSFPKGTKEQRIADFYATALDSSNRNKQGIEPVQSYINSIDESKTVEALIEATLSLEKDLGILSLFNLAVTNDAKNSNYTTLYYTGMETGIDKNLLLSEENSVIAAYIEYVTTLLMLSGEDQNTANLLAKKILAFEQILAVASLPAHESSNINKIYNPYSLEQFYNMFDTVNMKHVLQSMKLDQVDTIIVTEVKLAEKVATLLTESNLDVLKAYTKLHLLLDVGHYLSDEFRNAQHKLNSALYGVSSQPTTEDIALGNTIELMEGYLERAYIDLFFPLEAKQDIEQMVDNFIAVFKDRIQSLDWMSDTTKTKAITKLNNINVKVGYPDKWDTTLDGIDIKTYEDGGSLFSNVTTIKKTQSANLKAKIGKHVDRSDWLTSVYTVNAYYNPLNNEIVFPAGILQAPFYDVYADPEANYGAIGMIIAHEITHAFDASGSLFDEHGNARNWWTEEDYKNFKLKNDDVFEFYNGLEFVPGIVNNGLLTLSENTADLGGIATALQVLSKMENPDYELFFESNAAMWTVVYTRETASYLNKVDTHSDNKIRVNRTLSNFQEFQDTYEIEEGDGMYVAPEDRVSVW